MRKYIIFLLIIIFLIPGVKASTCQKEELERLKVLASKVEINYNYELKEADGIKYPLYSLTANNLNDDFKVLIIKDWYNLDYKEFKRGNGNFGTLNGFSEGENITITIKGYVANPCSGQTILTKNIKLPYYNPYSEDANCKKYPDFKYCAEFTTQKLTNDSFHSALKTYLNNLSQNSDDKINEKKMDWTIMIYIGIGIILLLALYLLIRFFVKQRRKNTL